jgi:serine/threonine-protein kinase
VYLDGERDGLTPRNLRKVPLGTHTIRVTRPAYATQEREVVLTAKEPSAVVEFTLRPGQAGVPARPAPSSKPAARQGVPTPAVVSPSLAIVTRPPGARVRVDGRDVGVTPLTVTPLQPGPHSVELQLQGYRPWTATVTLAAGQRRRLSASLERESIR